jgi:hypothetical protein
MCDVNSCNVFLLLFMALWVLISATLFRRAVLLVLWHAFLVLGLRFFFSFLLFCLVASTAFSCKTFLVISSKEILKNRKHGRNV